MDYIRSEQRNQYMLVDLNPGVRSTGLATGTVTRTNPSPLLLGIPFNARVDTIVNDGFINYDTVQVSVEKRYSQGYQVRLSYAFSRGRGNTDSGQADTIDTQLLDDLRLNLSEGPTSIDRPHILSLSGTYDVPKTKGLKVSGVLQARSGSPFSIIDTTFDEDRNAFTSNEYLPAGSYSGTGDDAITVENEGGRRGARGPGYLRLDLRAGYRIRLQQSRTLDLFVDGFNVTDQPNFSNPTGDRRSANFLRVTSILNGGPTRTIQFNVRYGF